MTTITLPRTLLVGGGVLNQLPNVLQELSCHRALLVTDAMMVTLGHAERIQKLLAGNLCTHLGKLNAGSWMAACI